MSVARDFLVPLFLSHGKDAIPETMVAVKSQGLLHGIFGIVR